MYEYQGIFGAGMGADTAGGGPIAKLTNWWGGQSTPTKIAVGVGGAAVVGGILFMLLGGSGGSSAPNRRRPRRRRSKR